MAFREQLSCGDIRTKMVKHKICLYLLGPSAMSGI